MRLPVRFLCLALLCVCARLPAADRPNFVLIAVDDLNHFASFLADQPDNFLQKIYPDPAVRAAVVERLTPNLQRLANQSLIFRRAYSASPLCGPSRTALLTGVPPHVSGYYEHSRHFRLHDSLREVVTLPQYLGQHGYFTAGLGKVFHKPSVQMIDGVRHDWPDLDHSWTHWIERQMGVRGPARRPVTHSPYSPAEGYWQWGTNEGSVTDSWDYRNADFAAELLATGRAATTDLQGRTHEVVLPEDQPFFFAVGLFSPHLPWFMPPELLARFPTAEMTGIDQALISLMDHDIEDLAGPVARSWLGNDFDTLKANAEKLHGPGGMVAGWRDCVQAYLAAYAFADQCIGRILDGLEASPARDRTVVMLWGDHGWHLGEKRRFRKHALWEGANHTVLLVRDPAQPAASTGRATEHLVTLQDLYPTVTARAGLPRPDHVHGHDLAPLLADPATADWTDARLTTFEEGNHALRTPAYHYIRYQDGLAEFYDLATDPFQLENRIADPAFAGTVRDLDIRLDVLLAQQPADFN